MNNGDNPIILLPIINETKANEVEFEKRSKGQHRSISQMIKNKFNLINDVSIRNRSQQAIPSLAKNIGQYQFLPRYKIFEKSRHQSEHNSNMRQSKGKNKNLYSIQCKFNEKTSMSNRLKVKTQFMTIQDHHFSDRIIANTRRTEEQLKNRIKSKILKFKSMLKVEEKVIRNVEDYRHLSNIFNIKCFYNKTNESSTSYQTVVSKSQIRNKKQQRKPPIFKFFKQKDDINEGNYSQITSIDAWNFDKDDFQ